MIAINNGVRWPLYDRISQSVNQGKIPRLTGVCLGVTDCRLSENIYGGRNTVLVQASQYGQGLRRLFAYKKALSHVRHVCLNRPGGESRRQPMRRGFEYCTHHPWQLATIFE
jgi:hypothetical protein